MKNVKWKRNSTEILTQKATYLTCVEGAETRLIRMNARGSFCLSTASVLNVTDGLYWSRDLPDDILE